MTGQASAEPATARIKAETANTVLVKLIERLIETCAKPLMNFSLSETRNRNRVYKQGIRGQEMVPRTHKGIDRIHAGTYQRVWPFGFPF